MKQNYSKEYLQKILNQYLNLGRIEEFFLFTSGYENSNFYIKTRQRFIDFGQEKFNQIIGI